IREIKVLQYGDQVVAFVQPQLYYVSARQQMAQHYQHDDRSTINTQFTFL
ncbi:unnamed protein product, partial [Heterotrigona itama]